MNLIIEICLMNFPLYKWRYVIVLSLALLWMTFFDNNSLIYRFKLNSEISDLEDNIRAHEEKIVELQRLKKELLGNEHNLEKYAREKYFMKKDHEDIFVIVDPEEEKQDSDQ